MLIDAKSDSWKKFFLTIDAQNVWKKERLKEGVSEKNLKDIGEEITVDSGRTMLIEKKDILNIKRDFHINGYIKKHEVDAVSAKLWVQEM
ncbi:hypothetical protein TNCT_81971 [Trichonephila clavata]|uniref:Uncharacterized protein n=1 Tax=Trichonephila clavata TaxID=2740835 RepID=A0A8X6F0R4_TRICU|nr:hypothetical protein TNCT_81971 [Trichonephila clavata]